MGCPRRNLDWNHFSRAYPMLALYIVTVVKRVDIGDKYDNETKVYPTKGNRLNDLKNVKPVLLHF